MDPVDAEAFVRQVSDRFRAGYEEAIGELVE
jgi:hypothetical protein